MIHGFQMYCKQYESTVHRQVFEYYLSLLFRTREILHFLLLKKKHLKKMWTVFLPAVNITGCLAWCVSVYAHSLMVRRSFHSFCRWCRSLSNASMWSARGARSGPKGAAASPRRQETVVATWDFASSWKEQIIRHWNMSGSWTNHKDRACEQDILTGMRTSVWPWARPCRRHVSCCHALSHTSLPAVRTSRTRLGLNSYPRGRRRLNTACMKAGTSLQPWGNTHRHSNLSDVCIWTTILKPNVFQILNQFQNKNTLTRLFLRT